METANISHDPRLAIQPELGVPRNLKEAAQEFESLFVGQLLQAMRKTVPQGNLFGSSQGTQLFRDMFDQELSKQIAASGRFGIGEMVLHEFGADAQASVGAAPPGSKSPGAASPEAIAAGVAALRKIR